MKRTLLLVLTLACDPSPCDTCDPMGTEIGDEGPALCVSVEETEVASDATVFGSTPEALAAAVEVGFAGVESRGSLQHVGPFLLTDHEPQVWEDDTPAPEGWADAVCLDALWVAADWELSVPGIQVEGVGVLRFLEDGAVFGSLDAPWHRGEMPVDPTDDEGGDDGPAAPGSTVNLVVEPGFEPSFELETMASVELWVRGQFDGSWQLDLIWVGETFPEGDDGTVRTVEELAWSGPL